MGHINHEELLFNLLKIILVLITAKLILMFSNRLIGKLFRTKQLKEHLDQRRSNTLTALLRSCTRYFVYFVSVVIILELLNVPVGSVLTTAGIAGIALAFGAQNLVRDIITGFFILFEDQFGVGDQVWLAGVTGVVEEIGLRITKVRDFGGQLHIIPNGKIERVTNFMGPSMEVQVDVPIAYQQPLEEAIKVLTEVLQQFNRSHPGLVAPAKYHGLIALTEGAMVLRTLVRTRSQQEEEIGLELRSMIISGFAANNIKPPLVTLGPGTEARP